MLATRLDRPASACTAWRRRRESVDVVAPTKTPRAAGDRVKTDRKDAELLGRLLMAGALTAYRVPPPAFSAA
jgi:transposase